MKIQKTRMGALLSGRTQRLFGLALLLAGLAAQAGTITYFHNDLAGSPLVATNEQGQVLWRENYRPYGERLVNSPAASGNSVWFTSRRQDAETGLVYLGARHYDPVAGRFVSMDPVGFDEGNIHSFNRYAYANNNPYRYVDPDGRQAAAIVPLVVGALIVGGGYRASPEQQRAIAGGLGKIGEYSLFGRLGAIVGQSILSETANASSESSGVEVIPRPDYPPQSGGRSGEKVKDATGPPNSAIPSTGGSVWVTDGNGNVVVDVTPTRAKPVIPGVGFGDKRPPTQGELDLWNQVKEPNKP